MVITVEDTRRESSSIQSAATQAVHAALKAEGGIHN